MKISSGLRGWRNPIEGSGSLGMKVAAAMLIEGLGLVFSNFLDFLWASLFRLTED